MENQIKIFNNPNFGEVRVAGTSDEPIFCLADVCKILGLTPKGVNQRLSGEVISNYPIIDSLGREQQALFVNEDGLYDVILDSRKPFAKQFRKWVTGEVLPSIRKSGGYIVAEAKDTPEEIMARALMLAQQTLAKREERMRQLEADNESKRVTINIQTEEIKKVAPKVNYYDDTLQSVNTMTTTQVAKELGMEANKLNEKLKTCGISYKQSGQWLLRAPYSNWGMHSTRTQTYTRSDGSMGTSVYTVWTQRGRRFIHSLNNNDWDVKKAIKEIKGEIESPILIIRP